MNMGVTCFVGMILAAASVAFANDTQKIVIKPVTKMCMIIKNLADNPLKTEEDETRAPSRESMLEETIDKIGILL